ncbi:hypothetical protein A0257_22280 [Hymenobacter psoromatis]|nr:hypothetical protein A0257_22280 [Hymenobacter psoromatis]
MEALHRQLSSALVNEELNPFYYFIQVDATYLFTLPPLSHIELMSRFRLPALHTSFARLFESPITGAYTALTLLLGGLASSLIFPVNDLPAWTKYLLMLLTMGWLARLCDSAAQRWAWLGIMSLLVFGLGLEISTQLLR